MQTQIKVNFGNGNPDDNEIINVGPPVASVQEGYDWVLNVGATAVQDILKSKFDDDPNSVFDFDVV